MVPCQEATEFFWAGDNLCAFVVSEYTRSAVVQLSANMPVGKPYYCLELKGKKEMFYNGVPLVVNSQGFSRIRWEKVDPRTNG